MVRLSVSPFWLWSNHLTALIPVLMEIDGVKIADDGTISFRDNERVGVDYLFGRQLSFFVPFATVPYTFQLTFASYLAGGKYSGDKCTLTVLRKGQVLDVETILRVYPALAL